MRLVWAVISLVMIGAVVGISESFAEEKTWHSGENLQPGDYFSFYLCSIRYNDCTPLQMDLWIEAETLEEDDLNYKWIAKAMVFDGSEIVETEMKLESFGADPLHATFKIEPYVDAFGVVTAVGGFSSLTPPGGRDYGPRSLEVGTEWQHAGTGGPTGHIVGTPIIQTPAGIFDSVLLQYKHANANKIWIVDEIPFPIKADISRTFNGVFTQLYKFELLDYKKNIHENPFISRVNPSEFRYELERPSEHGLSVKEQLEEKISPHNITCAKKHILLFKTYTYSPMCVYPDTGKKLIELGIATRTTSSANYP